VCFSPGLALAASFAVAWVIMKRWFDAQVWHVLAIGVINWVVQRVVILAFLISR
jgi:hypothetical protein